MSYIEDIQRPTPTQVRLNREHVERKRRLYGNGNDSGIDLRPRTFGVDGREATRLRALEFPLPEPIPEPTAEEKLLLKWKNLIGKYSLDPEIEPLPWRQSVKVREIQELFCAVWHIDRLDLISKRRTPDRVDPRHLCVMLCKILTLEGLAFIGREFGDRDHTTILHSCRRMKPVEDTVRTRLPADATLLQWVTETISVYREMPKAIFKGRGVKSND